MRTIRTLAIGLAVWLAPSPSAAQAPNGFVDSWFWGAKGGVASFTANDYVVAPSVGAEWLITRSRTALSVSFEQAFFETRTTVYDATVTAAARAVNIKDLRRVQASIFFFPFHAAVVRPYGGLGLALNTIQAATPVGTFASVAAQDSVNSSVDRQSSRASVVLTGGAQVHVWKVALFGQISTMPTRRNFLLNGAPNTMLAELGVRVRIAGAKERLENQ